MTTKKSLRALAAIIVAAVIVLSFFPGINPNDSIRIVRADDGGIRSFVTALYSECLGREPDPTGLEDWCQKLSSGQISGKQAAYGFFYSPEFLDKCLNSYSDETIERFYLVFLNRQPDMDGFYYWWDRICYSDGSISTLFNGFADSEEFRNKCISYGVNPGDHIDVPAGYGRVELFFRSFSEDLWDEGVPGIFASHTDTTPRGSYPMFMKNGAQTGTVTVSANDYAICQRFANEHFRPGWSDLQKLQYTALWIRLNVHYASSGGAWAQISGKSYADAIFNYRLGQCVQYNGALLAMMSYLGYDVRMVQGRIGGNRHFWGEMDYNGVTYTIDTGCIEDNNLCFMVPTAYTADYYTP
ncbi:MAG: DUF4214 domain-containing protein [Clostridiales bacterium]|nr:DUF4214 domain-containing protein [Clostridiales bacterium]